MENSVINDLVLKSKAGNRTAFAELVTIFQPKIFTLTFRLLCHEDNAKDAMQDTFLKAWLKLKTYNDDYCFSTWIFSIATHLCLDRLKSKKHSQTIALSENHQEFFSENENITAKMENKEIMQQIVWLTQQLTPKQKIVFALRYLEGLEIAEINQITGMSAKKINSNLYLARQTISKKMGYLRK